MLTNLNRSRIFLFFIILISLFVLQFTVYYFFGITNAYFFLGIFFFSMGLATYGEKLICYILLKALHEKSKSNIHTYLNYTPLNIFSTIIFVICVSGVMVGINNFILLRTIEFAFGLFAFSFVLLSSSFMIEVGQIVFINDVYFVYHLGIYKKIVGYEGDDNSIDFVVQDRKKRDVKISVKFKNHEVVKKVLEDLLDKFSVENKK